MQTRRPRIGFLTAGDARDRSAWSGTPFHMAQALQRHCGDVVHLGPMPAVRHLLGRVRSGLSLKLRGRRVPYHHSLALSREYARRFQARLEPGLDVIYACSASTEMAFLETSIPIVYSTDATLALLRDYYLGFSGLSERYLAEAQEIERRALDRSRMVLYPTAWAAESARRDYGVPAARVHVVPYGPNMDPVPAHDRIQGAKSEDVCRVVFLGVNWERKGGAVAYEAVRLLRARGVDATLTICGCTPPSPLDPAFTTVIPRLDKNVPEQAAALSELLLRANFLVLPTEADCFGIVFCEASAHGTPSVAPDTGGVGGAVATGENGILLPAGSSAAEYADAIAGLFRDRAAYRALVASSRATYEDRLNWDRWGTRVSALLDAL